MSSKIQIPIQPKDRNDEVYKLVNEFLIGGDRKVIALELDVEPSTVSEVSRGVKRSSRIWNRIMETVMKRSEEREQWIKHMKRAS